MLPYMDTDGEDHVRGLTSARCTFTAHLRRAEITGVKLPWQQACIIVTSPSVSPSHRKQMTAVSATLRLMSQVSMATGAQL